MIVDTNSQEMKWILLKFLKDSLDFLSDDQNARTVRKSAWATRWMDMNLDDEHILDWMPGNEIIIVKDGDSWD